MPFSDKRKRQPKQKKQIKKKKSVADDNKGNGFFVNKGDQDEILSESDDEILPGRSTEDVQSSESDEDETPEDKKVRLMKMYLKEIRDEESKRLENATNEEVEASVEKRLKDDYLKKVGRLKVSVGDKYTGYDEKNVTFLKCKEHQKAITCICVSTDNKFIYSGSKDGSVVKWSFTERKKVGSVPFRKTNTDKIIGHTKSIMCIAISSDNKFLAVGDEGNDIQIWNPENMSHVHTFKGHRNSVLGLVFRRETHTLFSCSKDRSVKVWSLDEMMYVETLFGHLDLVTSIDALVRDRAITSGGMDNTIRIWKIPEESQLIYNGNYGSIDIVRLINEDNFISGGSNGELSIWSTMKKKPLCTIKNAHECNNNNLEPYWICSIGSLLYTDVVASGSNNGFINFWKTGEKFQSLSLLFKIPVGGFVNSLAFTSDGRHLIAGIGREHKFGRWNVEKGAKNTVCIIPLVKSD